LALCYDDDDNDDDDSSNNIIIILWITIIVTYTRLCTYMFCLLAVIMWLLCANSFVQMYVRSPNVTGWEPNKMDVSLTVDCCKDNSTPFVGVRFEEEKAVCPIGYWKLMCSCAYCVNEEWRWGWWNM
jgi:hypothetical protein